MEYLIDKNGRIYKICDKCNKVIYDCFYSYKEYDCVCKPCYSDIVKRGEVIDEMDSVRSIAEQE